MRFPASWRRRPDGRRDIGEVGARGGGGCQSPAAPVISRKPGKGRKMKTGGEILIECLEAEGAERAFCVPGESYLAVLDALHDSKIDVINARQEGGAAMMAEADGKMT